MLAHGGTGGLLVELAISFALLAVLALAWLGSKKDKKEAEDGAGPPTESGRRSGRG